MHIYYTMYMIPCIVYVIIYLLLCFLRVVINTSLEGTGGYTRMLSGLHQPEKGTKPKFTYHIFIECMDTL